jgi:hypothetical protein
MSVGIVQCDDFLATKYPFALTSPIKLLAAPMDCSKGSPAPADSLFRE